MNHSEHALDENLVEVLNAQADSSIVVICEHASAHIPEEYDGLGLAPEAMQSHVVWDPGAMALASKMARSLNAVLVAAKTSRLVYDCNRPPGAVDAMPARSEVFKIPGNAGLTAAQRAKRVATYYEPFRAAVADIVASKTAPILVTVHSFTPVYLGKSREVEIGVLHDTDARFADVLLSLADKHVPHVVRRNEPYGPEDGVTHTLKEHALPGGHLNVMFEVRNDLIANEPAQSAMADVMSKWVSRALAKSETAACKV